MHSYTVNGDADLFAALAASLPLHQPSHRAASGVLAMPPRWRALPVHAAGDSGGATVLAVIRQLQWLADELEDAVSELEKNSDFLGDPALCLEVRGLRNCFARFACDARPLLERLAAVQSSSQRQRNRLALALGAPPPTATATRRNAVDGMGAAAAPGALQQCGVPVGTSDGSRFLDSTPPPPDAWNHEVEDAD